MTLFPSTERLIDRFPSMTLRQLKRAHATRSATFWRTERLITEMRLDQELFHLAHEIERREGATP